MDERQRNPPAHRFFHSIARRLVELAQLQPGETALEVIAGVGVATLYATPTVGPTGKVTTLHLPVPQEAPIDLHQASMTRLSFAAATFDSILCPSVIILPPDLPAALHEWQRLLKPGGRVALSGFGNRATALWRRPLHIHLSLCLAADQRA